MSIKVMQWVWENSPTTRGDRLVLLAIADCASDDGTRAWPSLPTIAEKANLSVRGCQKALRRLAASGCLEVEMRGGRGHSNMYRIVMQTVNKVQGEQSSGVNLETRKGELTNTERVNLATVKGEPQFTRTVREPSIEPSDEPSDARERQRTAAIIELAAEFKTAMPISNLSRTRSVIALALSSGSSTEQVRKALEKLIEENRGCTEETLRIALSGARASSRQTTTNGRVVAAWELSQQYEAAEHLAIEG
jgi:Helix-turn-helix domain